MAPTVSCALSATAPEIIALVDGTPISRADYDQYSLVFTDPTGQIRASSEQILEALIAQALVHEEITVRAIRISDKDVETQVRTIMDSSATNRDGIQQEGGEEALRRRARAFLEFQNLRSEITAGVVVSDEQVKEVYISDPVLRRAAYEDVAPLLTTRMHRDAVNQVWSEWLEGKRRCAEVLILDQSFAGNLTSPRTLCEV